MEPIMSSETSAIRTQTPGNYPKMNKFQAGVTFNYARKVIKESYLKIKAFNTHPNRINPTYDTKTLSLIFAIFE